MSGAGVLAVIPARGGSKGIPGKNIRPMAGRPMIEWSVEAAMTSTVVERVVVSTDSDDIAAVAQACGAQVPFRRPAELGADATTDLPVFQHCLRWLAEEEAYHPEVVVHLRPTAPLRTAQHIDDAVQLLLDDPATDCVRTICESQQHPLKSWTLDDRGWIRPFVDPDVHGIPEPYNRPRQALPRAYVQNGSVDAIRPSVIHAGSMTGRMIRGLVMDPLDSVNVDHELDFLLAELLLLRREER